MPRKKISRHGFHLKFIPGGRLNDLKEMADNLIEIKDKQVALYKFIETLSWIIERYTEKKKFIPVSQPYLRKRIKTVYVSQILKNLVANNFLTVDKSSYQIREHAYGYKPIFESLEIIQIAKNDLNKTSNEMLDREVKPSKELIPYFNVIKKIKFDLEGYKIGYKTNIGKKPKKNIDTNNDDNDNKYNDIINIIDNITNTYLTTNLISPLHVSFVPQELVPIIKIIQGKFYIHRPHRNSRVYTNITNLPRLHRPFLRLNEKPLIGFDAANSQPLLATIAFRRYSELEYDFIKDDVLKYQAACESGKFYDHFMEINNIDENGRDNFKKEFFGKVFYTKEVEKENYLKTQFKEIYPTCYEAIFQIKGGKFYSEKYKDFPVIMTEIETAIFFKVNTQLIDLGYDVISIHDSLYSDSEDAIALGKEMIIKEMQQFGITPLLKDIDYRNTEIETPQAPKDPFVDVNIKKELQDSPAKESENTDALIIEEDADLQFYFDLIKKNEKKKEENKKMQENYSPLRKMC